MLSSVERLPILILFLVAAGVRSDVCWENAGMVKEKCARAAAKGCKWYANEGCFFAGPREAQSDRCYALFQQDKVKCTTGEASQHCLWEDGHGCYSRSNRSDAEVSNDQCFKNIGMKKQLCMSERARKKGCVWRDGEGCFQRSKEDEDDHGEEGDEEDGCFMRFTNDKSGCTTGEALRHCLWEDGHGCYERSKQEGCFMKFGKDRKDCMTGAASQDGCNAGHGQDSERCKADPECTWSDARNVCHESVRDTCFARYGHSRSMCLTALRLCAWQGEKGCHRRGDKNTTSYQGAAQNQDRCFKLYEFKKQMCVSAESSQHCAWKDGDGCYEQRNVEGSFSVTVTNVEIIFREETARMSFQDALRPQLAAAAGKGIEADDVSVTVSSTAGARRLKSGDLVVGYSIRVPASQMATQLLAALHAQDIVQLQNRVNEALTAASVSVPAFVGIKATAVSIVTTAVATGPTRQQTVGPNSRAERSPTRNEARDRAVTQDSTLLVVIVASSVSVILVMVGIMTYLWCRLRKAEKTIECNKATQGTETHSSNVCVGRPVNPEDSSCDDKPARGLAEMI